MSNSVTNNPPRSSADQRDTAADRPGDYRSRRTSTRYFDAAPCEGPGCQEIVPAGTYSAQRTRSFCSVTCRNRFFSKEFVIGTCECGCGQPVLGRKEEAGIRRFTNEEHYNRFVHERLLGPTGCFRSWIESYLAGHAKTTFRPSTLHTAQTALGKFFRFVVQNGIEDVNAVDAQTVASFIAAEREGGKLYRVYMSHISAFFNYLIKEGRYGQTNPVIPRIHNRNLRPTTPVVPKEPNVQ